MAAKPKQSDLNKQLKDLVYWEEFALHLPRIRQPHIDTIKREVRDSIAGQKQALFNKWLQVYPKASWEDVIEALEKVDQETLVANLRTKLSKAYALQSSHSESLVPRTPEVHKQVTHNALVNVPENVVDDLKEFNLQFIDLTTELRSEVESKVNNDTEFLKHLVKNVEQNQAFDIDFQSVHTVDDFFRKIRPHYSFLDSHLIFTLISSIGELSKIIKNKADEYREKIEQFMKKTKIISLQEQLDCYFQSFEKDTKVKVVIALENAWGRQSVWLVRQLVKQLLCLEHPEQCQWFRITKKCLLLTLSASKCLTVNLLENSKKKLQFIRLVGVISLQIGDHSLLKEEENEMFSFENSLIQAAIEDNVEAVQFLIEKVKVNVDTQADQSIVTTTPDQLYQTESISTYLLNELFFTFTWLIKDIEFEVEDAVENGDITMADIDCELSELCKTTKEFFEVIRAHYNFLNCYIPESMTPILSASLAQQAKQYQILLKHIKKEVKIAVLESHLEKYFQNQLDNSVKVNIVLEVAWCSCSMWFVEELLQLVFSSTHFNMFQWFRVITTTESVGVVFLVPKSLAESLIENCTMKANFLKLSGVISLQIGEFKVHHERIDCNSTYSFKEGVTRAKLLRETQALHLLSQINQAPLATTTITARDENNNVHIYPAEPDSTALMIACCNDNTEMVKLLLKNNANPNVQSSRKFTASIYATRNCGIFQMLLDHNADLTLADYCHRSVLYWACTVGNIKLVKMLLEIKPDLVQMNEIRGRTELYTASGYGNTEIVQLFLQAHADPNTPNHYGNTPLHIASFRGHRQVVYLLLKAQADSNIRNIDGVLPLHSASQGGKVGVVELLLAKTDPNIPNKYGNTPLHIAAHEGHQHVCETLFQALADPNIQNDDGATPLHEASQQARLGIVELLLQAQVDPNIQDKKGRTPLYIASSNGEQQIVELLLQAQADPNIQDKKGRTPLYIASSNGEQRIVELLLQAKADCNICAEDEKTPLDSAIDNEHYQVIETLLHATTENK